MRQSWSDEQAFDCEVRIHQGPGLYIRRVCGEGNRTYPRRSASCPGNGTE